jgi:hypothetical protein
MRKEKLISNTQVSKRTIQHVTNKQIGVDVLAPKILSFAGCIMFQLRG